MDEQIQQVLTCEQHEDGSACNVTSTATPATNDARPESHKVKEEGHDEEGDHGSTHICNDAAA